MRVVNVITCPIMRMFVMGLFSLAATTAALAQPYEVPPTWGGDFWSRTRATGSWDGLRDELGKKGVVFDADLLLTPQDVVSGGRSTGGEFWGNADLTLNVDTDKLGLWPGCFIKLSSDTGFGTNIYSHSGATVPVNAAALIPAPDDRTTVLMNATLMQFVSTQYGAVLGKINTFDFGKQEFYGDYSTQFQNAAFLFPMTLVQVPISAFGGGPIALPTQDIVLAVLALDPSGKPDSNDLGHAFENGVMVVGSGALTIRPYGLVGHQGLGFSWSDKQRPALDQDPSNLSRMLLTAKFPRLGDPGPILERIFARFFPGLLVPVKPLNEANRTWSAYYSFDQYFWQPEGDSKHGIGVFFSFGITDGNPNPIKDIFIAGIGGKGMLPNRGDDSFGIGIAYTKYSSDFVPFMRQRLDLGLQHETAVEMYYNAAVTKWLSATADLQIVDSALNKMLDESSRLPRLTDISTAVVLGVRLRARF